MSEYIEREKAIDYLMEIINRPNHPEWLWTDEICGSLNAIPAADVRPVVRAHWKPGDVRNVTAVCSNCGHLRLGNGAEWATKLAYFCEKCGADMREES